MSIAGKGIVCMAVGVVLCLSAQGQRAFAPGEELRYRLHWGLLTAGYGVVRTDSVVQEQGRPAYRVRVFGHSAKLFSSTMFKVNDEWGSYIDSVTLRPLKFYRFIQENKYRKNEIYLFRHQQGSVRVLNLHKHTRKLESVEDFDIPAASQDLVSGFFHLRQLNMSRVQPGDIIRFPAFFEKESFTFEMEYAGTETIRTEWGRKECHVFKPFLPPNKIFRGDQPVTLWVSTDKNRLPLAIEADLWLGTVALDLVEAKGLQQPY